MKQISHIPSDGDLEKIVNGVLGEKKTNYTPLLIATIAVSLGVAVYFSFKNKELKRKLQKTKVDK